jgi:hypothetical protein
MNCFNVENKLIKIKSGNKSKSINAYVSIICQTIENPGQVEIHAQGKV